MTLKVVGCSYQTNWSISETADLLVFYPEKQTSKKTSHMTKRKYPVNSSSVVKKISC